MDVVLRSILGFGRGTGTIESQKGHPPVSSISESSFARGENNFPFLNRFCRFGGHEQQGDDDFLGSVTMAAWGCDGSNGVAWAALGDADKLELVGDGKEGGYRGE
ncbi:hypothetical protein NE237_028667 [Protea cynaroides]|uniref:Uncharacterized protein n=1 Tax=Protea cynaroides TaxID=273540 RepID=A0A9Q0GSU7_9MAGN|nr:hypothetical protein NE237_028667 [Protea cynaroides]